MNQWSLRHLGRQSNGGRARRLDAVENAPPMQLQDTRSHERMRRQRIGFVTRPVDDQNTKPPSGKKHGGGCAGASGSDD